MSPVENPVVSPIMEIGGHKLAPAVFFLFSVVCFGPFFAMAVSPPKHFLSAVDNVVGLVGAVIAAVFAWNCAIRFFWSRRTLVTLSSTGIKDVRVADHEIPWSSISRIDRIDFVTSGFWEANALWLYPQEGSDFGLVEMKPHTRTRRWLDKSSGFNRLIIWTWGLNISLAEFYGKAKALHSHAERNAQA